LFAFRFFLSSLLTLTRTKYTRPFPASGEVEFLPEWCVELMGYAIFLWISLEVITVYAVSADLAVTACFYFSTGAFLRLRQTLAMRHSLLLGSCLALGYWAKTILLPLGILSLFVGFLWSAERLWRKRLIG